MARLLHMDRPALTDQDPDPMDRVQDPELLTVGVLHILRAEGSHPDLADPQADHQAARLRTVAAADHHLTSEGLLAKAHLVNTRPTLQDSDHIQVL